MTNISKEKRDALKKYLNQYYYAKMREKQLKTRLAEFKETLDGLKAVEYSQIPKCKNNSADSILEEKIITLLDIEKSIKNEEEKIKDLMLIVIKIINLLPLNSFERIILEYRHIDCLGWKEISKIILLSRSRATYFYNKGIEMLLESVEVQNIICNYALNREINLPV